MEVSLQLAGGKFRSVMPSDLFHPGAFAKKSLPARVSVYATSSERNELGEFFKEYGCHSCGKSMHDSLAATALLECGQGRDQGHLWQITFHPVNLHSLQIHWRSQTD